MCVWSFKISATCFWWAVVDILSVLFKLQKRPQNNAVKLNAQTSRSTHVNWMLHSLPWLLSRGSVLTVFVLRSSSFHAFYTFTLLPSSSILLHTPESSAYHPSALSPAVSTLFLTTLSLNQLNVILLFLLQLQHIEDYDTLWGWSSARKEKATTKTTCNVFLPVTAAALSDLSLNSSLSTTSSWTLQSSCHEISMCTCVSVLCACVNLS